VDIVNVDMDMDMGMDMDMDMGMDVDVDVDLDMDNCSGIFCTRTIIKGLNKIITIVRIIA
jgi:hypothetical protein